MKATWSKLTEYFPYRGQGKVLPSVMLNDRDVKLDKLIKKFRYGRT